MFDFFLELFSIIFESASKSKEQKKSNQNKRRAKKLLDQQARKIKQQQKKSSGGVNHHFKAEELRKNGEPRKAIEHYQKAIGIWEDVSKPFSKAPAPYRELAKLYYHAGYQDKAVTVLSHYLEGTGSPPKEGEMKELKSRFESGDFRQLSNKYDLSGEVP